MFKCLYPYTISVSPKNSARTQPTNRVIFSGELNSRQRNFSPSVRVIWTVAAAVAGKNKRKIKKESKDSFFVYLKDFTVAVSVVVSFPFLSTAVFFEISMPTVTSSPDFTNGRLSDSEISTV